MSDPFGIPGPHGSLILSFLSSTDRMAVRGVSRAANAAADAAVLLGLVRVADPKLNSSIALSEAEWAELKRQEAWAATYAMPLDRHRLNEIRDRADRVGTVGICKYCKMEIPPNSFHRHLSTKHAGVVRSEAYWAPHEFVKRGHMTIPKLASRHSWRDHGYFEAPLVPELFTKEKAVIREALSQPSVLRTSVCKALGELLARGDLGKFDRWDFKRRIEISKDAMQPLTYYRKMSNEEWNAVAKAKSLYKAAFKYTNTTDYRYWISSSLQKVQAFGNENAAGAEGVIVRITFSQDPIEKFRTSLAAHQQPGVQKDATKVAVHREGFAEIDNMKTLAHLEEVLVKPRLHHNLGFTSNHAAELGGITKGCERL
jgi:hypothetical protein